MSVLITGATGHIGRWLTVELTRAGAQVIAPIRPSGLEDRGEAFKRWVAARGGAPNLVQTPALDLESGSLEALGPLEFDEPTVAEVRSLVDRLVAEAERIKERKIERYLERLSRCGV